MCVSLCKINIVCETVYDCVVFCVSVCETVKLRAILCEYMCEPKTIILCVRLWDTVCEPCKINTVCESL